jgi:hypothetical protein
MPLGIARTMSWSIRGQNEDTLATCLRTRVCAAYSASDGEALEFAMFHIADGADKPEVRLTVRAIRGSLCRKADTTTDVSQQPAV